MWDWLLEMQEELAWFPFLMMFPELVISLEKGAYGYTFK